MIEIFQAAIREAAARKQALRIRGGGSKEFYGGAPAGDPLETTPYAGVLAYEPTELYFTACCGTPLAEIEEVLARRGQMLAFEPPHFEAGATLGGCIAAGLSGPRRASAGAVRDFVLGVKIIDGRGDLLTFGGQVMKNVAGYDVSRLMVGALGTLGLIVEASLKVLPIPPEEANLRFEMGEEAAIEAMNRWATKPLPVSATCWHEGLLSVRLSGSRAGVAAARKILGGEAVDDGAELWHSLRNHFHPFFFDEIPLWRVSVPSNCRPLGLPGRQLIEWGGSQRWVKSAADSRVVRDAARAAGGHATLFRAPDKANAAFQPLPPSLLKIHRRLKQAFDPAGILNPGRMYEEQ
jgi:glycolate oxidase FAD binding subunit